MRHRTISALFLLSILAIVASVLPSQEVRGDIWDYCSSYVDVDVGPHCWVVCPEGDGPPLGAMAPAPSNGTITVTVRDFVGAPIAGVPAADFWLFGTTEGLVLCGGAYSINATGPTDASGQTTISAAMAAGGCDEGLWVIVQGIVLVDRDDCTTPIVVDIQTRSPDGNGDLVVNSVDFNQFGNAWTPLGGVYDPCMDFDCNGLINSVDFNAFGNHWLHACL